MCKNAVKILALAKDFSDFFFYISRVSLENMLSDLLREQSIFSTNYVGELGRKAAICFSVVLCGLLI